MTELMMTRLMARLMTMLMVETKMEMFPMKETQMNQIVMDVVASTMFH